MRSSTESLAVRKITGTSGSSARMRRITSSPSKSGSIMSSTMASGLVSLATFTACPPEAAVDTCQPS